MIGKTETSKSIRRIAFSVIGVHEGQNGLRRMFFEQMSTKFDLFFVNGLFRKIQIEDWEFDSRWQD